MLLTDLALVAIFGTLFATIGVGTTLLVQLPILAIGGAAGIWLFYVQHQFEGVYWEHRDKRDYVAVAMQGSSFYALPADAAVVLRQHRLPPHPPPEPAIPNYRLPECHREQEVFQQVDRLTLRSEPAIAAPAPLRRGLPPAGRLRLRWRPVARQPSTLQGARGTPPPC